MYIKIAVILLAVAMLLTGCAQKISLNSDDKSPAGGRSADLMTDISPTLACVDMDMYALDSDITDFSLNLFKNCYDGNNTLISPLSVASALGLAANGARGNTLSQLEDAMGLSRGDLSGYIFNYMKFHEKDGSPLHMANGIWFKDIGGFSVKQDFLNENADYYGAGIYKAPFDEATLKDVNDFVSEHTDGMIDNMLDRISDEALLLLVNALAFDAKWQDPFDTVSDGTFTTADGAARDVEMMHSTEHLYLEDEDMCGFIKYYEGSEYAFAALIPQSGDTTIKDCVDKLTGEHLHELLISPADVKTVINVPKFTVRYSAELIDAMMGMGVTDAFDPNTADFSGMSDTDLFISRILHKTFLELDEEGTKAAASTIIEVAESCAAPGMEEIKYVTLDRPFLYMIIDCEHSIPVFIGVMADTE